MDSRRLAPDVVLHWTRNLVVNRVNSPPWRMSLVEALVLLGEPTKEQRGSLGYFVYAWWEFAVKGRGKGRGRWQPVCLEWYGVTGFRFAYRRAADVGRVLSVLEELREAKAGEVALALATGKARINNG